MNRNKMLLTVCLAFTSYSTLADGCDTNSKRCTPSSPFDVTNTTYVSQISSTVQPPEVFNNPFACRTVDYCFGANVEVRGQLLSLMQGMRRYVEESDSWAEAVYWLEDLEYTEGLNEDRTDHIAYAILTRTSQLRIEDINGDENNYRGGDIIHGSDWNNNGKIDSLEVINSITYGIGGKTEVIAVE